MRVLAILAVLVLAGCGADGEPERPEKNAQSGPGFSLSITGKAEVGITG